MPLTGGALASGPRRVIALPEQDPTRKHRVLIGNRTAPNNLPTELVQAAGRNICYYEMASSLIAQPLQEDTHLNHDQLYHRLVCCGSESFKKEVRDFGGCYDISVADCAAFVIWCANTRCDAAHGTLKKYVSWIRSHWETAYLLENQHKFLTREDAMKANPWRSESVKDVVDSLASRYEPSDLTGNGARKLAFRPTMMRFVVDVGLQLLPPISKEVDVEKAERYIGLLRAVVFHLVGYAYGPRPIELYHTVSVNDLRQGFSDHQEEFRKKARRKLSVLCFAAADVQFVHSNKKFGKNKKLRSANSSKRAVRILPKGPFADALRRLLQEYARFREELASATRKDLPSLFFLLPGESAVAVPENANTVALTWCNVLLNYLHNRDPSIFEPQERDMLTSYSTRFGLASTFSVVHKRDAMMLERLRDWGAWARDTKVTEEYYIRPFTWQNIPVEKEAGKYFFGNFI